MNNENKKPSEIIIESVNRLTNGLPLPKSFNEKEITTLWMYVQSITDYLDQQWEERQKPQFWDIKGCPNVLEDMGIDNSDSKFIVSGETKIDHVSTSDETTWYKGEHTQPFNIKKFIHLRIELFEHEFLKPEGMDPNAEYAEVMVGYKGVNHKFTKQEFIDKLGLERGE